MSGAAYLGALAAYRTGTGLVQIYIMLRDLVDPQSHDPGSDYYNFMKKYDVNELHRLIDWADVVAIGSGLGTKKTARKILKETIAYTKETLCHRCETDSMFCLNIWIICVVQIVNILSLHRT
ncbi:MAG: NAD(P)H-hydrate dehydratase [Dorea sp.]